MRFSSFDPTPDHPFRDKETRSIKKKKMYFCLYKNRMDFIFFDDLFRALPYHRNNILVLDLFYKFLKKKKINLKTKIH
jgi:hypothetical protein